MRLCAPDNHLSTPLSLLSFSSDLIRKQVGAVNRALSLHFISCLDPLLSVKAASHDKKVLLMTSRSLSVTSDGGVGDLDLVVQHVGRVLLHLDERLLLRPVNLARRATVLACVNLGNVDHFAASGLQFRQREIAKLTFGFCLVSERT